MILRRVMMAYSALSQKIPKPSQIQYKTDMYRSIHLSLTDIIKQNEFKSYIDKVMQQEGEHNKISKPDKQTNAVWVHLTQNQFGLATYLSHIGFKIHHGLGNKLVLYKWISSRKDLSTHYSAAYISAGAIIIKDDKILLVQQKNGSRKGDYGIPGGRSDFGQPITSCAERQLFEETNIKATFKYILHFRELEKTAYGAMDFYFACVMDFEQNACDNMKICQRELSDYKWVPLAQYQQFSQKNAVGTQFQLAKYISKLYREGYDFKTRKANQAIDQRYVSGKDQIQRLVIQHGLVQGIKMDKAYSK